MDIVKSLKYPFKDEEWTKKLLIGSLLTAASIFIIPIFTVLGYLLRVLREDSLPGFNDLGQMTIEGFKAAIIFSIYAAIPLALIFSPEGSILYYTGGILYLVSGYLMYSVFYEIANNGWKAAFSKQVLKNAFTIEYFGASIAAGLISWLIMIPYVLSLILIVPIILFPAVYLYQYIFMFRLMKTAIESE